MSEESHGPPMSSAQRSRIKPTIRKNADTANSKQQTFEFFVNCQIWQICMVWFQTSPLISFGLGKCCYLRLVDFHWGMIIWRWHLCHVWLIFIYRMFYLLVNAKLLIVGKLLADGKLLIVSKYLVDAKLFPVAEHLVDTKHLASMKMFRDLAYLSDLTIYEKLDWNGTKTVTHTIVLFARSYRITWCK